MSPIEDSSTKHAASSSKKKQKKTSGYSGTKYEFVNISLNKEHIEEIKTKDWDMARIDEWQELMCDDGHKFSYKLEKKSGTYLYTCSGVDEKCQNYGLTLTSRAPSLQLSLLALYFKSEILLGGLAWRSDEESTSLWS